MNLLDICRFGIKLDDKSLSKGFFFIYPLNSLFRVWDVAFNRFQSVRIDGSAVLVAYFKAIIRWRIMGCGDIDRTHRALINHRIRYNRGWSRPLRQVDP